MSPAEQAALQSRIRRRLLDDEIGMDRSVGYERRWRVRAAVSRLVDDEGVVMSPTERARVEREIADSVVGLGPLEPLLRDPEITEIMVNRPGAVFVERSGRLERADVDVGSAADVLHLIDRVVGPLGLRVDGRRPWVDARLPDGSRVHAIIPPLAVHGPALTIRKFGRKPLRIDGLESAGSLTREMTEFLRSCVRARMNILVSGGAGVGKTTMLNALSEFIPPEERIVTIEDAAELQIGHPNVVALEARSANVEGAGAFGIRELVRNALRMRPDRIVVGEVRGGEALDMLQAMNTGHSGSMSTAHANTPEDVLTRLEALVLMGDVALPLAAVRAQLAAGLDLIVHLARSIDGARHVAALAEVRGGRDREPRIVPLVGWHAGVHRACGEVPSFLPRLRSFGEPLPVLFRSAPA